MKVYDLSLSRDDAALSERYNTTRCCNYNSRITSFLHVAIGVYNAPIYFHATSEPPYFALTLFSCKPLTSTLLNVGAIRSGFLSHSTLAVP